MQHKRLHIKMRRLPVITLAFVLIISILFPSMSFAEGETAEEIYAKRMALYSKMEAVSFVPWYYIAAVDQYERNIARVRKDIPLKKDGYINIYFKPEFWVGELNPIEDESFLPSIEFFAGNGRDGNGDLLADRQDDEDLLQAAVEHILQHNTEEEGIRNALTDYYQDEKVINQIMTIARLYKHFGTLDLRQKVFPVPLFHNYSYRSTWGDRRGWGGRRIHEGTDLFASYGVPVRSVSYGVVEIMGWNKFGGWRVGVRDADNVYHYYAHLSGFNKEVKEGSIVEPGTVLGYVGSSGYGKPGTSGKFPPHLHYGMYKFNGRTEWAYDPYPSLRIWEKNERKRRKGRR